MNVEFSPVDHMERTILGACLDDNEAGTELVLSLLRPEHFGLDSHRRIFLRIRDLHESQQPINDLTLSQDLEKHKEIEVIGGWSYISSLTDGLPRPMSESSLRNYAERVKES